MPLLCNSKFTFENNSELLNVATLLPNTKFTFENHPELLTLSIKRKIGSVSKPLHSPLLSTTIFTFEIISEHLNVATCPSNTKFTFENNQELFTLSIKKKLGSASKSHHMPLLSN